MNLRPSTRCILAFFAAVSVAVWFSYCAFPRETEGRAFLSSLMRSESAATADSIAFRDASGAIRVSLEKRGSGWFVLSDGRATVPADVQKIDSLLSALTASQTLREARSFRNASPAFGIAVISKDGTVLVDIDFLGTDAAGTRIAFRTSRDVTALLAEDVFSAYSGTASADWIDHEALSGLERNSAAQRIVHTDIDGKISVISGFGGRLSGAIQALSSLALLDASPYPENFADRVSVEFGDMSELPLAITPAGNGDYCIADVARGYAWIISGWSYRNIAAALE